MDIHVLVTFDLDYCNTLFIALSVKTRRSYNLSKTYTLRLLTGVNLRDHKMPGVGTLFMVWDIFLQKKKL